MGCREDKELDLRVKVGEEKEGRTEVQSKIVPMKLPLGLRRGWLHPRPNRVRFWRKKGHPQKGL